MRKSWNLTYKHISVSHWSSKNTQKWLRHALSETSLCSCGEVRPERPSQTLPRVSAACASYRQHSQPDALDTKDTSIRAIMLLQLSRLKPSVFRSLSERSSEAETESDNKKKTKRIGHTELQKRLKALCLWLCNPGTQLYNIIMTVLYFCRNLVYEAHVDKFGLNISYYHQHQVQNSLKCLNPK